MDIERAWDVHPQVSLRPEPFGAMLYHFGTRKLSFLKDRTLLSIVETLAVSPSVHAACKTVGVSDEDLPRFTAALEILERSAMLIERAS
ncbi:MAG: mycofactocin system protein MftB [Naasia sp.]|jgi:putative mycofactocin binding protein MftB|uniref:mycofactocin biosynthesis chaperone MftB n=1 Tax=Naasia sp. TaxID=2546198 RepID=UPI002625CA6E|nr:mycofactocin biosynthesis chaperone MftB [Naasia sp.]MCU1571149.1 mycofactocin system protein MftB [Naasia sp.]